jgi:hypothetical protein
VENRDLTPAVENRDLTPVVENRDLAPGGGWKIET